MANFAKHGKESSRGWSEKLGQQMLVVGQDAEIGLFGGGPGGVALEVAPNDRSVCTVHERQGWSGEANWRRFVITALKPGNAMVEARMPAPTRSVSAYFQVQVSKSGHDFKLMFFPGERPIGTDLKKPIGTIYVIGGDGEQFAAAGGMSGMPAGGKLQPGQGGHTAESTPPGRYILGPKHHVVTPSWPQSVIPWGAPLRITAGEVEFRDGRGRWRLATGPKGEVTSARMAYAKRSGVVITAADNITVVRGFFINPATGSLISPTWIDNDFGVWGWNLRRMDGSPTGYYVHTTPTNEHSAAAGQAVNLSNSHGCIHIIPADRDAMISKGYLKAGVEFDVRPYTETGPPS